MIYPWRMEWCWALSIVRTIFHGWIRYLLHRFVLVFLVQEMLSLYVGRHFSYFRVFWGSFYTKHRSDLCMRVLHHKQTIIWIDFDTHFVLWSLQTFSMCLLFTTKFSGVRSKEKAIVSLILSHAWFWMISTWAWGQTSIYCESSLNIFFSCYGNHHSYIMNCLILKICGLKQIMFSRRLKCGGHFQFLSTIFLLLKISQLSLSNWNWEMF